MGGLNPFSKPKMPAIEPVKIPTKEESAEDIAKAQEEEKKRLRTQRGRAATILNKPEIVGDDSGLATKKLLGG